MRSSVVAACKFNDGLKILYIREENIRNTAIFVV